MSIVNGPKTAFDFAGLGALKAEAARDRENDEAIKKTAQQFESMFLQMMMKSMRATVEKGGLFDSKSSETFEQMYDQQIVMAMAERRATGLSQMIEDYIRRSQASSKAGDDVEKFFVDPQKPDAIPLVNGSTDFQISEEPTSEFLLKRFGAKLGGDL